VDGPLVGLHSRFFNPCSRIMFPRWTMTIATSVTLMVRFISLLLMITLLTAVFREEGRHTSAIYYFDAFLFNTNLLGRLEGFPPWSRLIHLICIMVLRHECHFQSQLPIMYLNFSLDRKKNNQASCQWLRVSLYINVVLSLRIIIMTPPDLTDITCRLLW